MSVAAFVQTFDSKIQLYNNRYYIHLYNNLCIYSEMNIKQYVNVKTVLQLLHKMYTVYYLSRGIIIILMYLSVQGNYSKS